MLRFVLRRLLLMVPVLFGLCVLLFAWLRALPGDPARAMLGEKATPEAIARINAQFGFDQPLHVQFVTYLGQLAQGNFGASSRTGEPVVAEAPGHGVERRRHWMSPPAVGPCCDGAVSRV